MIYSPERVIERLEKYSIKPFQYLKIVKLGIVLNKNCSKDDLCYLKIIKKKAEKYEVQIDLRECVSAFEAIQEIQSLRENSSVNGIIIIGSFGKESDRALANAIPARLDLDCISSNALGELMVNNSPTGFRQGPCTSIACYKIIEDVLGSSDFSELKVLVLGRSLRVGRPLAEILCSHNATVTVAHSRTQNAIVNFKGYDIVVSAIGQPNHWKHKHFSIDNTLVIDVGINVDEDGNICGDIDNEVYEEDNKGVIYVKSPGGVGPITTTVLFAKLFYNCALMNGEIL